MLLKDLAADLTDPPYAFVEHELPVGKRPVWQPKHVGHRSFVVIGGRVRLEFNAGHAMTVREFGFLKGWHAMPGATYRFAAAGLEPALVVEVGSAVDDRAPEGSDPGCVDLAGYRVEKPWGHEVWYTSNLDGAAYALKQIHMTAGHQSSLQSHERKVETNYVVEGEATVLNGTPAPADPHAVIDVAALPRAVHGRRSGWSSAAGVLHRVIAQSDYTSIEVSTTELDDVIRWADDTNRGNGRIELEHLGGRK